MMPERPRRSRKPLVWGGILAFTGIVAGIGLTMVAFTRLNDKVASFSRLGVPDVAEVFFDSSGEYIVYNESLGLESDGEVPFEVTVRRTGTGLEVPVRASVDDIEYDTAGKSGTAVFEFSIPAVGVYEIQTTASGEAGLAQLAIGQSVLGDLVRGLVLAAVVGGGMVVLGILVAVIGSLPRRRSKRAEVPASASSREATAPAGPGHGRSPLQRRSDAHRAEAASRPPPPKAELPPPPPPTELRPPPPPPHQAVASEPPAPKAPRRMPEPELTEPMPEAPADVSVLSVDGLDLDSALVDYSAVESTIPEAPAFEPLDLGPPVVGSLEPVVLESTVMGLDEQVADPSISSSGPIIAIEGLTVSTLQVQGLTGEADDSDTDSEVGRTASLRP